jgi:hypothetical protein
MGSGIGVIGKFWFLYLEELEGSNTLMGVSLGPLPDGRR